MLPELHNGTGEYQGGFRMGHLDELLLHYAIEVSGGVDGLALTHLDAMDRARAAGVPIHGCARTKDCRSFPSESGRISITSRR